MSKTFLRKTTIFVIFTFSFFFITGSFPKNSAYQKSGKELLEQGKELYKYGEYRKALEAFEKAEQLISDNENLEELYLNMSLVHYALGNSAKTEEYLRRRFRLNPNYIINTGNYPRKFIEIFKEVRDEVEADLEAERQARISEQEKIIEKPKISKKIKKKKFPVLLVLAGIAVSAAAVLLLLKLKDSDSNKDNQTGPNYDTNVLGIEWIDISAGDFQMGDNFNEGNSDERPVHTVYLDAYKISKYEVTFEQYDKFCDDTGRNKPSDFGWGRGNRPVIHVNWNDAKAFCDWLSQKTGKNIHLPTEAQWEKAARGTDQRRYPWGNGSPSCSLVNYIYCHGKTVPVGSYPSGVSPYGVHDMAGNVREWCSDWYDELYYRNSPRNNPTGPSSGYTHVLRGGFWHSISWLLRSAFRDDHAEPTYFNYNLGIRLCQD